MHNDIPIGTAAKSTGVTVLTMDCVSCATKIDTAARRMASVEDVS